MDGRTTQKAADRCGFWCIELEPCWIELVARLHYLCSRLTLGLTLYSVQYPHMIVLLAKTVLGNSASNLKELPPVSMFAQSAGCCTCFSHKLMHTNVHIACSSGSEVFFHLPARCATPVGFSIGWFLLYIITHIVFPTTALDCTTAVRTILKAGYSAQLQNVVDPLYLQRHTPQSHPCTVHTPPPKTRSCIPPWGA